MKRKEIARGKKGKTESGMQRAGGRMQKARSQNAECRRLKEEGRRKKG